MFFDNAKRFTEVVSTHRPYSDVSNAAQVNTIGKSANTTIKIMDSWKRSSSPFENGRTVSGSPPRRSVSPSLSVAFRSLSPTSVLRVTVDEDDFQVGNGNISSASYRSSTSRNATSARNHGIDGDSIRFSFPSSDTPVRLVV
jgi:hypothetical protein